MGLDIYLYTNDEQQSNDAYEKASEEYWQVWSDKPDSPEKTAAKPKYQSSVDVPSKKYPDHLFNRRYLRSSYNEGGFNRAVPDMVGKNHDLYWIFEPVIGSNPEPYHTVLTNPTALERVKQRALNVAQDIRDSDPLRTTTADCMLGQREHQWQQLPTEDEVLAWYREEQKRERNQLSDGGYTTAKGTIFGFGKGIEILAATLGRNSLGAILPGLNQSTAVLVYRMDEETKQSYIQSAEIVAEFCDEASELIRKDGSAHMHWSG